MWHEGCVFRINSATESGSKQPSKTETPPDIPVKTATEAGDVAGVELVARSTS